jgi:hypothetical protein
VEARRKKEDRGCSFCGLFHEAVSTASDYITSKGDNSLIINWEGYERKK